MERKEEGEAGVGGSGVSAGVGKRECGEEVCLHGDHVFGA